VVEEIEVKLPYDVKRSDEDIAAAAIDRLGWNSSIPDGAIEAKVEKGWVTLSGMVDWHFEKVEAERDIRALSGVIGVSNKVLVKPTVSASSVKDDIEQALRRSWYCDPDTIQVNAVGGKIKLTGTVTTWNARRLAGTTAWSAPGADVRQTSSLTAVVWSRGHAAQVGPASRVRRGSAREYIPNLFRLLATP
jgi:osmotically-inducible protein OsmY